jgi:hypothetical protein
MGDTDKLDRLQHVFDIKDSKAKAIQQKEMIPMMMKMAKDMKNGKMPEGMEGFADMMKGMEGSEGRGGGGGGLADLLGGGGKDGKGLDMEKMMQDVKDGKMPELSPEQIKESIKMMKQMVDSGMIGPAEVAEMKKEFQNNMGTDVQDMITNAEELQKRGELDEDGREMLELLRTMLDM